MKKSYMYTAVLAAIVLGGCQKNELRDGNFRGKSVVSFNPIVTGNGIPTRSQSFDNTLSGLLEFSDIINSSEDGTTGIPITSMSSEGIGMGEATSGRIVTKGELINEFGPGPQPFDTDETFVVKAWDASTSGNIIPGTAAGEYQTVTYSSSSSKWGTSKDYSWQDGETKTFYAYSNLPSSGASISNTTAASQTLTYTVPSTASAQTDILMGCCISDGKSGNPAAMTGTASILFSHPLTAVQFKLGVIDGITSFVVNSITIEGVYASGTAVMTPATAAEADPKDRFTWTPSGSKTVSQTVSTQPTASSPKIGEAFLLIPQSFNSESTARIVINCTIDGKTVDLYHFLTSDIWKAGYTNTYSIGNSIHTSEYTFKLTNTSDAAHSFDNTTSASAPVIIPLTSTVSVDGGEETEAEWIIKSVKVGSETAQTVNAESFDNIGGFSANQGDGSLKITSLARVAVSPGDNAFWKGNNGDWSPADWSETKATPSSPIDLSKFNFQTESMTSTMTTANCYIIRHAGTYMLPLVYGNGVKSGIENTVSYYPGETGGNYRLERFKNHLDAGITSAFIENNDGCAAVDAAVIYQDKAKTVKNLSIEGTTAETYDVNNVRYLKFTVDESAICQNNAVICIKDDRNRVIWSWHIWMTNNPAILDGAIDIVNVKDVHYRTFPITCLGWFDPQEYLPVSATITLEQVGSGNTIEIAINKQTSFAATSSGVLYQYGRKDPLMNGLITSPAEGHLVKASSKANTLGVGIQNPDTMYPYLPEPTGVGGGNWDWCYDNNRTTYYNLWTGKQSSHGWDIDMDATITKTIYDPSPADYMVPPSGAYTNFDFDITPSPVIHSDQVGTYFRKDASDNEGIFFGNVGAYTGYDCSWQYDSNMTGIFGCGYYWTAHSLMNQSVDHNYSSVIIGYDNQSCASIIMANGWGSNRWNLDRSFGCAVRPVTEE